MRAPQLITPAPAPMPLYTTVDLPQLDEAIDYAARVTKGTVSEFLAAPSRPAANAPPYIEIAVEFFIPPCSPDRFADELDRALTRRSLHYAATRRAGHAMPLRVTPLSPSVFHQWRLAWKIDPRPQRAHRWSNDRRMLDQILRYANSGWRELYAPD